MFVFYRRNQFNLKDINVVLCIVYMFAGKQSWRIERTGLSTWLQLYKGKPLENNTVAYTHAHTPLYVWRAHRLVNRLGILRLITLTSTEYKNHRHKNRLHSAACV